MNVWELEPGRGIDILRGLLGSTYKSIFSPDSRLVAALSNDWHVGIWDRAGRLVRILEVAPGFFADNAALAFSPDGRRFAFAAGQEASLWDTATGKLTRSWKLPPGLVDRMAFPEPNRLLLFRTETETGEVGPFSAFPPDKYPRVCRVRDLLSSGSLKPLAEIRDCNLHVYGADCSADGKYYVIKGLGGSKCAVKRVTNLYDGPAGKKLGDFPTDGHNWDGQPFSIDPTGSVLNYAHVTNGLSALLLELPSRAVKRQLDEVPYCLGPRAERLLIQSGNPAGEPNSLSLLQADRREPLIKLVLDLGHGVGNWPPQFSPDGLRLVWGNPDGAVTVVDLVEVQRRLAEFGLGW